MTDPINFRALCAEMAAELDHNRRCLLDDASLTHPLADRARVALAEQVTEPPAVAERPSDDELGLIYHDCCGGCEFMDQGGFEDAARAVLARWGQPPAPPAEGEVAELVAWLRENAEYSDYQFEPEDAVMFRRIAELLELVPELLELAPQLETERMRLAVCGVVAMSDTPESAAKARDCNPDYWSASADDIARQIDELMRLRARMERHAAPVPVPAPQGGEVE